jgi:hypothetical protein
MAIPAKRRNWTPNMIAMTRRIAPARIRIPGVVATDGGPTPAPFRRRYSLFTFDIRHAGARALSADRQFWRVRCRHLPISLA